jgi:hypothetical protein
MLILYFNSGCGNLTTHVAADANRYPNPHKKSGRHRTNLFKNPASSVQLTPWYY